MSKPKNVIVDNIEIDESDYFIGDDTALDFEINDFDFKLDVEPEKTRYTKPQFSANPIFIDYTNAVSLVNNIKLKQNEEVHCIVPGNFIFGDFIEALLIE